MSEKALFIDESKLADLEDSIKILFYRFHKVEQVLSGYNIQITDEILKSCFDFKIIRVNDLSESTYNLMNHNLSRLIKKQVQKKSGKVFYFKLRTLKEEIYKILHNDNVMCFDWWSENVLSYIHVTDNHVMLVNEWKKNAEEECSIYIKSDEAAKAYNAHRRIAETVNEFARIMKKVPSLNITSDLTALFRIQKDGSVLPTVINYDKFV